MLGCLSLRRCLMSVSFCSRTFLMATSSEWNFPRKTAPWAPLPSHCSSEISSNGTSHRSTKQSTTKCYQKHLTNKNNNNNNKVLQVIKSNAIFHLLPYEHCDHKRCLNRTIQLQVNKLGSRTSDPFIWSLYYSVAFVQASHSQPVGHGLVVGFFNHIYLSQNRYPSAGPRTCGNYLIASLTSTAVLLSAALIFLSWI